MWKPCKPKFGRPVLPNSSTVREVDMYKDYAIEEKPEGENEVQQLQKNKEIVRNALLIANKIAFNSHKNRFENKSIVKRDFTPGPGYYNATKTIIKRNLGIKQTVPYQPEDRGQWAMAGSDKLGPGLYYEDSEWIRPSYNVTMPNNVLYKKKEKIQSRFEHSADN